MVNIRMAKPYSKIVIGSNPEKYMGPETAGEFDVFINLTSSPKKTEVNARHYWVPIHETSSWDTQILKSKEILDFHYGRNDKIYLYCDNGINRTPCIAMSWLMSRGHNLEEAALMISENDKTLAELNQDVFLYNIKRRYISASISN